MKRKSIITSILVDIGRKHDHRCLVGNGTAQFRCHKNCQAIQQSCIRMVYNLPARIQKCQERTGRIFFPRRWVCMNIDPLSKI